MASSQERDILRLTRDLLVPDDRTNWWHLAKAYATFGILAGSWWQLRLWGEGQSGWRSTVPWLLYPLVAIGIGSYVQARISALAHEASHFLLFRSRRLNDFVADVTCIFPLFGAIKRYREIHLAHHWHANDPERDPDLARVTKLFRLRYPLSRRDFYVGFLFRQLTPPLAIRYLLALSGQYSMKSGALAAEEAGGTPLWLRVGWYSTLAAVLSLTGLWEAFAWLWVAPFLAVFPVVLAVREVFEHGQAPAAPEMLVSRRFELGFPWQGIVFPTGLDNHQLHHMCPQIPHFRLEAAHQRVMEHYPPYREQLLICRGVDTPRGAGPSMLDVLGPSPGATVTTMRKEVAS